ncbi:MAG: DUF4255 domain-containing protein [Anaerolineaceae bacterium]|nr:DUF4255 domain-containing protein [Anaerolineaceae bacterium]
MSNFLSIATVTEAFRQVLNEAATSSGVSGASATAVRPTSGTNNGQPGNPPVAGVNIYLYQVTPNGTFRNVDAPTRRNDGTLLTPTRSAYDLHYLLSFYGSDVNLEPQRIMGNVIRVLHSVPVLTHKRVESVKMSFPFLATSNLETEVDTVKLSMLPLNLEELSKIWSVFFQTTYSLSVAFQASVVFIDGTEISSPALPVNSRNVYVRPFEQPQIDQILSQKSPTDDALLNQPIVVGDRIVLTGKQLEGEVTYVRLGTTDIVPLNISDSQVSFILDMPPFAAQSLRAGVQGLQVIHRLMMGTPETEHVGVESNVAAFVLRPLVLASAVSISNHVVDSVTLCTDDVTLNFTPRVGVKQKVVLLLNEFNPPSSGPARAYRFDVSFTPPSPSDTSVASIVARVEDVAAGDYLVRVQIDGAESPLDPGTDPVNAPFFVNPKVTIL